MKTRHIIICLASAALMAASCSDEKTPAGSIASFPSSTTYAIPNDGGSVEYTFRTDFSWELSLESGATWLEADVTSGKATGSLLKYTITFTGEKNGTGAARKAVAVITYGEGRKKEITLSQSPLHLCSETKFTADMVFSTTLGRNTTNVQQGFDYDPDEDVVYLFQKYGAYRNHVGWDKRTTDIATTAVASNYMTLCCFSHGNNIAIEKDASGKKWVWAPNYGTRQDDGSYDYPHVISRFPLETAKQYYNTETTENYYFGSDKSRVYPSFDFKNDIMVVCDVKKFYVYRLSELMALPDETITMEQTITYGGVVGTINSKIDEWTGNPVIKAKDCRKVSPLYTIDFTYSQRGLHWQTFCVENGYIYALLNADIKADGEIKYDSYIEIYKFDTGLYKSGIRQEYMQDWDSICAMGWTHKECFYCEPEGIKITDGVMLILYTIKGNADPYLIRRPVIMRFASPL